MLPETKNTRKQVRRNTQGIEDINDRGNRIFRRVSKRALTSSVGDIKRAACSGNAGGTATIQATLYNPDGTDGDEVTVYCNISNGTALNTAVPRLEINDDIFVTQSTFNNAGTPEVRWYCVTNFNFTENCVCTEL